MNLHFDEMISSPTRLAILAVLVPGRPVSFKDMKATTKVADGNLHVQTHKLADAGYLQISKASQGRRSVTEFCLTELGLERFQLHVRKLQAVLDSAAAVPQAVHAPGQLDDSAVWL